MKGRRRKGRTRKKMKQGRKWNKSGGEEASGLQEAAEWNAAVREELLEPEAPVGWRLLADWTRLDLTGPDLTGSDWIRLDQTWLDYTRLDWTRLDWSGLNWIGLEWTGPRWGRGLMTYLTRARQAPTTGRKKKQLEEEEEPSSCLCFSNWPSVKLLCRKHNNFLYQLFFFSNTQQRPSVVVSVCDEKSHFCRYH